MKSIVIVGIIGVAAVVLIAGIVTFQFIQQQSAIKSVNDLLNEEQLKAEYNSISDAYDKEAVEKCLQYDNPNNLSETTPMQQKCYQDLMDKHGLSDNKYDSVRTEVMLERADRLIEASNRLSECMEQGFSNC